MNTTQFQNFVKSRLLRWAVIASGIAVALVAPGDRNVFSAVSTDSGIDPLDVLTTKTRPNVYFVLDSSASMAEFTDSTLGGNNTTEDEANSKMAQAKAVLRSLVQANQGIANFALARYKGTSTTLPGSGGRFVYATDDIDNPTITTSTLLFDLKQFSIAGATIPFTENGTARTSLTVAAGNYNTGWDLAAAVQTALNGTPGRTNTYKVTFVDGPGGTDARFTIAATNTPPATFVIKGTTMNATLRTTLGFAAADVSTSVPILTPPNTGSSSYNLATADAFTFTENGTSRSATLAASNYTTSALLATGLQNALNAAVGKTNTYSVTFTSSRYVVTATAGGATFTIDGGTFVNTSRTALGYNNAIASSTGGGSSVAAPNEPSGAQMVQTANRTSSHNTSGKGRTGVSNTEVDWISADKFFQDMTLRVNNADHTPCGIDPAGVPSLTSAQITVQPMTSCDPTASPTTTGTAMTFKFSGTNWSGTITGNCIGLDPLVGMGACTNNLQFNDIEPYLRPTLNISGGAIAGYSQTFLGAATFATNSTLPEQLGIRQNAATPIAESLLGTFKEFNTLWLSTIHSQPVGKRQKNFVIFLTDGDDTCATTTSAVPGSASTSNLDQHALRAAYVAQELYKGVDVAASTATRNTAGSWPPAAGARDAESKVTTFVVIFGAGVQVTNANYIAWGGTGMVRPASSGSSFGLQWNSASPPNASDRTACTTCKDAFTASTAGELSTALQNAINLTQEGEFSDQQSVTESVYEYVALAPTPGPTVPPTPTPAPQDPMNALSRYSRTVPVILQSTFVMPGFQGHLTAFRNNGGASLELWDAGQKLEDRVVNGVTGTDGMGAAEFDFATLRGDGTLTNIRTSTSKIKRRIITTRTNGSLTSGEYTPQNLVDQSTALVGVGGFERVPLWPPSATVSPSDGVSSAGILDTAMGLTAAPDLAAVQALVPDACKGATAGNCTTGTTAAKLAKAKREARELILAWLAGAQARRDPVDGAKPKRVSNEIVYVARPWVLAESSLAAPAVVAPPPQAESTDFKRDEYLLYRDGPRKGGSGGGTDPCAPALALSSSACFAVNGLSSGFGLRNPDLDGSSVDGSNTAQALPALKPLMSIVYHATNAGLHAFRAGPCPSTASLSGIGSGMALGCETGTLETGGEELWAFVPFDQLDKLNKLMVQQQNDANKVYMLAAPVRFSDIWIDGGWTKSVGTFPPSLSKSIGGNGVWRTLAFFGRGAGGKFMTGMDVSVSGTVGSHTLDTTMPVVMWNRGNGDPDSTFSRMGQTWSVPAIGRVVAADFNNNDHVLFMGSGYSPVVGEGQTFFVMSPRNGDIIRYFSNMTDGATTAPNPPFRNKLVASPSIHSELLDGRSPLDATFLGNPAGTLTKTVFFPDLHGRIWRYSPDTPGTAPVIFADARTSDGVDQPIANSLALLRFYPTPLPSPASSPAPPPPVHVFAESGNDNRVPVRIASPFFKMYGYRDSGSYPVTAFLTREFPAGYRGQVQPATAFVGDKPVVFFAGNKFSSDNAGCVSQFDAVLFALNAATNAAAFDLRNDPAVSDDYIQIDSQRINAIRVAGSRLVVDTGLKANVAPPPPDVPTTGQTSTVGQATATVMTGVDPNNAAQAGFRTTVIPYRLGTSTCRANQ